MKTVTTVNGWGLAGRGWVFGLLLLLSSLAAWAAMQGTSVDLPPCEASSPGRAQGVSLGIVQPFASEHVVAYAARLTLAAPDDINICAESWNSVLPRWAPWAGALERGIGWGVFALAFVAVVTVLWHTTSRHWWRRTTLLGMLAIGMGSWLAGWGLLAAFQALGGQRLVYDTVVSLRLPQQAQPLWLNVAGARELESVLAGLNVKVSAAEGTSVAPAAALAVPAGLAASGAAGVVPSGTYRVAHRLNLREGPGTQHPLIVTLARGDSVLFDGATQGDWWRIRTASGAVGWSSSLWLRRPVEGLPQPDTTGVPRS